MRIENGEKKAFSLLFKKMNDQDQNKFLSQNVFVTLFEEDDDVDDVGDDAEQAEEGHEDALHHLADGQERRKGHQVAGVVPRQKRVVLVCNLQTNTQPEVPVQTPNQCKHTSSTTRNQCKYFRSNISY